MKFDLYATLSINGFIADENGDEGCFEDNNWNEFKKIVFSYKNLIWGRKTFEMVLSWGEEFIKDFEEIELVVISNTLIDSKYNIKVCKDLPEASEYLKNQKIEVGLISGGKSLYSFALKNNYINRMILHYNPVVINSGIPIFKDVEDFDFKITNTKIINENILEVILDK